MGFLHTNKHITLRILEEDPAPRVKAATFLEKMSQLSHGTRQEQAFLSTCHWPWLFPEPISHLVSWINLLVLERGRRVNGLTRGPDGEHRFPGVPDGPIFPPWYSVAIIGAGVAGLRTAKLLQDMGIPYKIFEASDRPGGRVFTYEFAQSQSPGKHDYYDVGAMRFPDNEANEKTFELFKELGLESKLIEYVMGKDDNIRYYNGQC